LCKDFLDFLYKYSLFCKEKWIFFTKNVWSVNIFQFSIHSVFFFTICSNGWRYAQYGISKPLPYQDAERMKRATDAELRCIPRIAYDRMLPTCRSYYLSVYHSFALLLAAFSVRALGQPYSLTSFG
jgi:hypothetical protein